MPAVLVELVPIAVALLLLAVAFALTVIFAPIIEGILRQVPFVGGVLAGKAKAALEWTAQKLVSWANAAFTTAEHWFTGLTDALRDFVDAVNAFIVSVPERIDHLAHVTVHEIVKAFVNPVRDLANDAKAAVDGAVASVAALVDLPLSHFKGIEHGVDARVDSLRDLVENIDLPNVLADAAGTAGALVDGVAGDLAGLQDFTDKEFARLWDQLHKLPLQQILEGLAASAALGALVHTIAREAGLDSAECRGKFKQVCATNPAAWTDLLALAGVSFIWPGFGAMVDVARDLLRELEPAVKEVLGGG